MHSDLKRQANAIPLDAHSGRGTKDNKGTIPQLRACRMHLPDRFFVVARFFPCIFQRTLSLTAARG